MLCNVAESTQHCAQIMKPAEEAKADTESECPDSSHPEASWELPEQEVAQVC